MRPRIKNRTYLSPKPAAISSTPRSKGCSHLRAAVAWDYVDKSRLKREWVNFQPACLPLYTSFFGHKMHAQIEKSTQCFCPKMFFSLQNMHCTVELYANENLGKIICHATNAPRMCVLTKNAVLFIGNAFVSRKTLFSFFAKHRVQLTERSVPRKYY